MSKKVTNESILDFFKRSTAADRLIIKELLVCSADEHEDYHDLLNRIMNPPTREIRIKSYGTAVMAEFISVHNQGSEEQVHSKVNLCEVQMSLNWDKAWLKQAILPDGTIVEEAI